VDWKPLYDKLIVLREAPDEKLSKEVDIVASERHMRKKNRGVVLASGPGRITPSGAVVPLTVAPGMMVLFGEHSGIELEEKDHVMLREDEVLAYSPGAPIPSPE
jgi:chaperonin GroES